MKKWIFYVVSLLLFMFILFVGWIQWPFSKNTTNNPYDYLISHGCGSLKGEIVTNSKEALFQALSKGYKYVEADLFLTSDSQLVCVHDISRLTYDGVKLVQKTVPLDLFLKCKMYNKFTPMTFSELLAYQEMFDFKIVTDKISDAEILSKYVTELRVRQNVLVESFSIEDYEELKANGFVPLYSLTIPGYRGYYKFVKDCIKYGGLPDFIVTRDDFPVWLRRTMRKMGTRVAICTVNDPDYIVKHIYQDADYVYTDL